MHHQKRHRIPGPAYGLLLGLVQSAGLAGAASYYGTIDGLFNTVQYKGQYINQTAGANSQTPPTYSFVNRDNTATAVTTGIGTSTFTWGSCAGCGAAVTSSSISWTPNFFANQAPDVDFLLGTLTYTNGTILLPTGTYGATLNFTGNVKDANQVAVAVTGLAVPYTNWDTINLTTSGGNFNNKAVKGLAGNTVVDATGKLFDNNGNAILDSAGNQVTVPGPNFYNTFWSADYITFQPGIPFANFSSINDAGTFEGQTSTFDVYGQITSGLQVQIDGMKLDAGAEGTGFAVGDVELESSTADAPEPTSLLLVSGAMLTAGLRRQQRRA